MCFKSKFNWFISFATISVSLSAFATGSVYVWPSPYLPKFNLTDSTINPIGRPITITESTWIVAAMNAGLNFGPLLSFLGRKIFTKKQVILMAMLSMMLAHSICIFANKALLFILARLLMGISTGWLWTSLGTYIAEIAANSNRGLLGILPGIMSNIGILTVYVIGPYFSMKLFSIFNLIPLMLFYISFGFFVPDSPYDLLEEIRFEDLVKDRVIRRGLVISISLMVIQQLSGIFAVSSYAETIFQSAGDFIPPFLPPILLGIVGVLTMCSASILIDKMGRKPLQITSCIIESISLFGLGLYFHLLNRGFNVASIAWLPMVLLMVFTGAFHFGLNMIPWIVTGEIFHSNLKAMPSSLAALSNFATCFLVSILYPYMVEYFGMSWTFYFFTIMMILAAVFCYGTLLETKGKSFQEIQILLNK
ncbi:hypothetical protein ABEB36_005782 [Hypothenemus hampei]|uniref:Major facilitator superfamily (MFS) profile domain-containing protein n=1 Tax=Hypothenemus hampei TaxID=57062 RepID=A0ABD1EZU3_HYPHA